MHYSEIKISHHKPLNAHTIARALEIQSDSAMVEIGPSAGGHLTIPVADILESQGTMIALDVQPHVLSVLEDRARSNDIHNIIYVHDNIERAGSIPVEDETLDAVFMGNVLHQIEDKQAALAECARVLQPGGKMLIIDWDEYKGCPYQTLHPLLITPYHVMEAIEPFNLTHIDKFHVKPYYWAMLSSKV